MSEDFKDVFDETNEIEEYPDEPKKSGKFFSKIKKNIEARREAVGNDDEYDIFDLQEIMDIDFDENDPIYDKVDAEEPFDDSVKVEDVAEESDTSIVSKVPSFISKLRKNSKNNVEVEEVVNEETAEEVSPVEENDEIEQVEEVKEEYVSPLENIDSFMDETDAALDDINKMLASIGIDPIENSSEKKKSVNSDDIQKKIEEETQVDREKTRRVILTKKETKAAEEKSNDVSINDDGQLVLEGYADEEPEKVDEAEIEKTLRSKRKNIVDNFRVFSKNAGEDQTILEAETDGTSNIVDDVELRDGEGVFEAVEHTMRRNKSFFGAVRNREKKRLEEEHVLSVHEMRNKLNEDKKRLGITTKILFGICALMLVLAVLPSLFVDETSAIAPLFMANGRIYVLINLVLYLTCVLIDIKNFINYARHLIGGVLNSKAVFLLANAVVLIQMLAALAFGVNSNTGIIVYGFVGAVVILVESYGELQNCRSLLQTISTLTKSELRGIQPIENKLDSAALGYDLSPDGDPSIYYSTDAKLPENIAGLTKETSFESLLTKIGMLIAAISGIVIAVVVCILNKSAYPLYTALPCSILLMLPVFRPLVLSIFKALANKMSIVNGVAVLSYDECDEIARANAVVFDAQELLNVNVSSFKKAGKVNLSRSEAVIQTAAILKCSDSLLSGCFDDFIRENNIELPEVKDFQYEEGLGFFGVVNEMRVIVGNRKCMELHSIECPTEEQEKLYCPDGIVLYTSNQEQIVSTFVVRYGARRNIRKQIDSMQKTGLVVMVRLTEPTLDDEAVADILGCSIAMIKIIGSHGNDIIKDARDSLNIYRDNGILCAKKKNSLLNAISAGCGLSTRRKHSRSAQFTVSFVWLMLFAFLAIFRISTGFTAIAIVIFEAIAAVISFFLGKIGSR